MAYTLVGATAVIEIQVEFGAKVRDLLEIEFDTIFREEPTVQIILLKFNNVRVIDSQALGFIISLHKKSKLQRKSLAICEVSDANRNVFRLAQLDRILKVYSNFNEAMEDIQQ